MADPVAAGQSTNEHLVFSYCVQVHECTCSSTLISRYQKRLSGPLLDRIDIHVEVPRVPFQKLSDERRGESSASIRARVEGARAHQTARFASTHGGCPPARPSAGPPARPSAVGLACNADMGPTEVRDYCQVDEAGKQLLGTAMRQMQLSARAYHRILKLARTIADLAGEPRTPALRRTQCGASVQTAHIAEAIQYRPRRQG